MHVDVLVCLVVDVALASSKPSSVLKVSMHAQCSLATKTHVTAELSKSKRHLAYNLHPFSFRKIVTTLVHSE